jgi:hypothetical protein
MLVLLLVVIFNTSKLTHFWLQENESFGVSLLQTNTNTSMQTSNVVIISKKMRGRDTIKSTRNEKRFPRRLVAKLLPVNV